jgi:hypothetical protein
MQLILAIDSDPRRLEQLASLVHARLRVDLVHATSAGEGLHALKDRVPDLILTAPLISPFDDGVLDEYLRELGAAGAHVQTLRIPVLSAAPKKRALASRVFLLGRTKTTSAAAPDGCDPKVFADEVAVYLARAAEARQSVAQIAQASAPRQDEVPQSPVVASPVVADSRMNQAFIEEFTDAIQLSPTEVAEPRYVEVPEPRYVDVSEPQYVTAIEPSDDLESEPLVQAMNWSGVDEERLSAAPIVDTMTDAQPMTRTESNPKAPGTSDTFEAALAAIRAAWVKPDGPGTAPSSPATAATSRSVSPREVDLTNSINALGDIEAQPRGFSALVDKRDDIADSKEAPDRTVVPSRIFPLR